MRRVAVMFAVLIVALVVANQATAKQSAMAKAVYAVKEEIGNEWELLTTVPKSLKLPGTRASVSCKKLSATRFRCTFTATNSIGYQAYGDARVKVFPYGAEATLLRAKCYVEAEGEVLPGLICR